MWLTASLINFSIRSHGLILAPIKVDSMARISSTHACSPHGSAPVQFPQNSLLLRCQGRLCRHLVRTEDLATHRITTRHDRIRRPSRYQASIVAKVVAKGAYCRALSVSGKAMNQPPRLLERCFGRKRRKNLCGCVMNW